MKEKEKMPFKKILTYIKVYTPKKIKNEKSKNTLNDLGKLVKREYSFENINGEIHTFIIEFEKKSSFITHIISENKDIVVDINSILN